MLKNIIYWQRFSVDHNTGFSSTRTRQKTRKMILGHMTRANAHTNRCQLLSLLSSSPHATMTRPTPPWMENAHTLQPLWV
jgi:hypothetical protein